jgi:hypothetical protein
VTAAATIASVVEGHGDVKALPVLLRRIAGEVYGIHHIEIPPPFRLNRSRMTDSRHMDAAVRTVSARVRDTGGVLVVADADDDCAVELAARLREAARPGQIEVAVAVREFEAWYLGAVSGLRNHRAVRADATFASDAEAVRDAKGTLSALMVESYKETLHQAAFAAALDIDHARQLGSFTHLVRCVGRLIDAYHPT